jgi:hypothetical protein
MFKDDCVIFTNPPFPLRLSALLTGHSLCFHNLRAHVKYEYSATRFYQFARNAGSAKINRSCSYIVSSSATKMRFVIVELVWVTRLQPKLAELIVP